MTGPLRSAAQRVGCTCLLMAALGAEASASPDRNAAIQRRPDSTGERIAAAFDAEGKTVAVEGLPLKVRRILPGRRMLASAPWHEPGGDWTFIEAELSAGRFYLAFRTEPKGLKELPEYESGEGMLIVRDARSADRILKAVAAYLHLETKEPPTEAKRLRPLALRLGIFGRRLSRSSDGSFTPRQTGSWTCSKLTIELESPEVYAELFFNFDPASGVGELSEKEPEFRKDVLNAFRAAAGR